MDDITIPPPGSKNLTRPTSSRKNGVAVLGEIMGNYIAPLQISRRYRGQWEASRGPIGLVCLGDDALETPLRFLGVAKGIHDRWLRHYAEIEATHRALTRMLMGSERVDAATATRMVSVLFAALGMKKSDAENAMLLAATVDMLSPLDACVGAATGLWEPINQHPFILAVAIKRLIATAKFTSAAELRAEMKNACNTVGHAAWAMEYIAELIWRADEIVFIGDRAAWDANYASVSSSVALAMRDDLINEEPYIDDDDNDIPPSERWRALDALAKRGEAA